MMTDKPVAQDRLPVGLTVVTTLALALLVALGAWQLQRMAWKRDLLAHIGALQTAPARPIDQVLTTDAGLDFARVTAVCPGLASAPYVKLYSLVDGKIGVRLISACALTTGPYGSVLVDRGFLAETVTERPSQSVSTVPTPVTGVLRQPDKANFVTPVPQNDQYYSRDVAAMAKALKADRPASVMLFAETSTNPELKGLQPIAVPAEISNRHLEYALTWFGLAAALLGVYVAVLVRGRRV
jgi:surfeit locus 1 family protein